MAENRYTSWMNSRPTTGEPKSRLIETLQRAQDTLSPVIDKIILAAVESAHQKSNQRRVRTVLTSQQHEDILQVSRLVREVETHLGRPQQRLLPNTNVVVQKAQFDGHNGNNKMPAIVIEEATMTELIDLYEQLGVVIKRISESSREPSRARDRSGSDTGSDLLSENGAKSMSRDLEPQRASAMSRDFHPQHADAMSRDLHPEHADAMSRDLHPEHAGAMSRDFQPQRASSVRHPNMNNDCGCDFDEMLKRLACRCKSSAEVATQETPSQYRKVSSRFLDNLVNEQDDEGSVAPLEKRPSIFIKINCVSDFTSSEENETITPCRDCKQSPFHEHIKLGSKPVTLKLNQGKATTGTVYCINAGSDEDENVNILIKECPKCCSTVVASSTKIEPVPKHSNESVTLKVASLVANGSRMISKGCMCEENLRGCSCDNGTATNGRMKLILNLKNLDQSVIQVNVEGSNSGLNCSKSGDNLNGGVSCPKLKTSGDIPCIIDKCSCKSQDFEYNSFDSPNRCPKTGSIPCQVDKCVCTDDGKRSTDTRVSCPKLKTKGTIPCQLDKCKCFEVGPSTKSKSPKAAQCTCADKVSLLWQDTRSTTSSKYESISCPKLKTEGNTPCLLDKCTCVTADDLIPDKSFETKSTSISCPKLKTTGKTPCKLDVCTCSGEITSEISRKSKKTEDKVISLYRTRVCSSMEIDVTSAPTRLRSKIDKLTLSSAKVSEDLRTLGVDQILRACRPAKCCRKAILDEKQKIALPYSVSLKSLPLNESDINVIKQSIDMSLRKIKKATNIADSANTRDKLAYYVSFSRNFEANINFPWVMPVITSHLNNPSFIMDKLQGHRFGGEVCKKDKDDIVFIKKPVSSRGRVRSKSSTNVRIETREEKMFILNRPKTAEISGFKSRNNETMFVLRRMDFKSSTSATSVDLKTKTPEYSSPSPSPDPEPVPSTSTAPPPSTKEGDIDKILKNTILDMYLQEMKKKKTVSTVDLPVVPANEQKQDSPANFFNHRCKTQQLYYQTDSVTIFLDKREEEDRTPSQAVSSQGVVALGPNRTHTLIPQRFDVMFNNIGEPRAKKEHGVQANCSQRTVRSVSPKKQKSSRQITFKDQKEVQTDLETRKTRSDSPSASFKGKPLSLTTPGKSEETQTDLEVVQPSPEMNLFEKNRKKFSDTMEAPGLKVESYKTTLDLKKVTNKLPTLCNKGKRAQTPGCLISKSLAELLDLSYLSVNNRKTVAPPVKKCSTLIIPELTDELIQELEQVLKYNKKRRQKPKNFGSFRPLPPDLIDQVDYSIGNPRRRLWGKEDFGPRTIQFASWAPHIVSVTSLPGLGKGRERKIRMKKYAKLEAGPGEVEKKAISPEGEEGEENEDAFSSGETDEPVDEVGEDNKGDVEPASAEPSITSPSDKDKVDTSVVSEPVAPSIKEEETSVSSNREKKPKKKLIRIELINKTDCRNHAVAIRNLTNCACQTVLSCGNKSKSVAKKSTVDCGCVTDKIKSTRGVQCQCNLPKNKTDIIKRLLQKKAESSSQSGLVKRDEVVKKDAESKKCSGQCSCSKKQQARKM